MADAAANLPSAESLAAELGYSISSCLKAAADKEVYVVGRAGANLVLKCWKGAAEAPTPYAVVSHRLLPLIAHSGRGHLAVPEYLFDGFYPGLGHYVVMSHIAGADYRDRWHYTNPAVAGGRGLPGDVIDVVLGLLQALRGVPTEDLVASGVQVLARPMAGRQVERRLAVLEDLGVVPAALGVEARAAIRQWAMSRSEGALILSNDDFRLRNFIELPDGRTALIDWDNAKCSSFEIEHCLSYQYLLLWNRDDLRTALIRRGVALFGVDVGSLRSVLIMRALVQAHICRTMPDLAAIFVETAWRAIEDDDFVTSLCE